MSGEADALVEEIERLAEALAMTDDPDVVDFTLSFVRNYKDWVQVWEVQMGIDERDYGKAEAERRAAKRLYRDRLELRDCLKELLAWARQTGRMP